MNRKWATRKCEENDRGPKGHWEIRTNAYDGHDVCVVQCVYSEAVAKHIVKMHNATIKEIV